MERAESKPHVETAEDRARAGYNRLSNALLVASGVAMLLNLYLIFIYAPLDATQGQVYRALFVHVPLAWISFLAFGITFVGSVMYLWKGSRRWDALALSSAEIGVLFTTLVLVTGVFWAKPIWGTWWQWEPRLTTTLILWLIYVAYLMVRSYAPNPRQGARYAAVIGIIGLIDVPIVYFSVEWWRSVHFPHVVGPLADEGTLPASMRSVLMFSLITFTLLFAYLLRERLALKRTEDALKDLRDTVESKQ